jgi:hypothetical protein
MGKPTKKNIRRKNRRTRRIVNKKKMKKGGVSFGFNQSIGLCNADEEKVNMITYNIEPITEGTFLDNDRKTAKLKKICKDKTNTITYLFKNTTGKKERMTSEEFKGKYIYYQPSAEGGEKFEYKIEGDTLSKKIFPKNPIKSMFSFFRGKK